MTNCEELREVLIAKGAVDCVLLEDVPPELAGHDWYMRNLSGEGRDAWDIYTYTHSWTEDDEKAGRGKDGVYKPGAVFRSMLVALTLCDSDGHLLFNPHSPKEVAAVAELDGQLILWLYDQAKVRNSIGLEAVEEAEKNLPGGGSCDTGTSSPPSGDAPSPTAGERLVPPSSPDG